MGRCTRSLEITHMHTENKLKFTLKTKKVFDTFQATEATHG